MMDSFTPMRPRKGGRMSPSILPTSSRLHIRDKVGRRPYIVLVVVCLCLVLFFNFRGGTDSTVKPISASSGGISSSVEDVVSHPTKPNTIQKPYILQDDSRPGREILPEAVGDSILSSERIKPESVEVDVSASRERSDPPFNREQHSEKASHKKAPSVGLPATNLRDPAHFDENLRAMISILPDEVYMRELTRPLESTGKERLRELALRTRAYARYLQAWEALHVVSDENDPSQSYVRDDVMQTLWSYGNADIARSKKGGAGKSGNMASLIHSYEAYRGFLKKLESVLFPWFSPYIADQTTLRNSMRYDSRGIVFTAGDEQAPFLMTSIPIIRKLGCTLPIEVMYLGDEDLGEDLRIELENLPGVVTRDMSSLVDDEGWKLAGWALKPFAIFLSTFREVIFIDADTVFMQNPEVLFEDESYKEKGALFFQDRVILPESKKRWLQQIFPKPVPKPAQQTRMWTGESGHVQESGVVVVDKWRHFVAMLLVTRMNGPDRDGNGQGVIGVYEMVYGDKETFWIGWLLAGDEDYAFHAGHVGILGRLQPHDEAASASTDSEGGGSQLDTLMSPSEQSLDHIICGPQVLHLGIDGRPLWFNGWLLEEKASAKSKKRPVNFEDFLTEPKHASERDAWQLREGNACCLRSLKENHFSLTGEEKEVLSMYAERYLEIVLD